MEIADRRQKVAERYLRGEYQSAIARELMVDQATISRDLQAIRAMWLAEAVRSFDAMRAQELARIDAVERAAWQGWERSMEERQTVSNESDGSMEEREEEIDGRMRKVQRPKIKKVLARREGQSGNPAFLSTILQCIERRCAILGLDAPKRFAINRSFEELSDEEIDALIAGEDPRKVLAA